MSLICNFQKHQIVSSKNVKISTKSKDLDLYLQDIWKTLRISRPSLLLLHLWFIPISILQRRKCILASFFCSYSRYYHTNSISIWVAVVIENHLLVLKRWNKVEILQESKFLEIAKRCLKSNGAEERTWTSDLLITNQLLYQLSYFSASLILQIWRQKFQKIMNAGASLSVWKSDRINVFYPKFAIVLISCSFKLAPPIRTPSTESIDKISSAFFELTLPP